MGLPTQFFAMENTAIPQEVCYCQTHELTCSTYTPPMLTSPCMSHTLSSLTPCNVTSTVCTLCMSHITGTGILHTLCTSHITGTSILISSACHASLASAFATPSACHTSLAPAFVYPLHVTHHWHQHSSHPLPTSGTSLSGQA